MFQNPARVWQVRVQINQDRSRPFLQGDGDVIMAVACSSFSPEVFIPSVFHPSKISIERLTASKGCPNGLTVSWLSRGFTIAGSFCSAGKNTTAIACISYGQSRSCLLQRRSWLKGVKGLRSFRGDTSHRRRLKLMDGSSCP